MVSRKQKPRIIPEQDRKICGTICICQMVMVLSCVSFVYLGVAIYVPSHKAFNIGIDPKPVTCHTVDNTLSKNCIWPSCGEWCLTKNTGICPQFYVSVRQNGTDVAFENCTRLADVACPRANEDTLKRYNCNNNTECKDLSGIFKCRLGHCANISEIYNCQHGPVEHNVIINSGEDNLKLNGIFNCVNARCLQIKKSLTCDRYCNKITTSSINVYIRHDDNVYTADCKQTVAYNMADGKSPPISINATTIWSKQESPSANATVLFVSCTDVIKVNNNQLRAQDCINGTIVEESLIPHPFMNFSQFWSLYKNSTIVLDRQQRYLPMQNELRIYNHSKLFINLEGCVNTLRNECKEFIRIYGKNGTGDTAESRFLCYYNKNDSAFVVTRFDLNKTWLELMIAVCVPGSLFIVSFVTLMIITQTVKVGDDARMRCKWWWCNDTNSDTEELNVKQECDERKVAFSEKVSSKQDSLAMQHLITSDDMTSENA